MSQSVQNIIDRAKKGLKIKTDSALASYFGVKPNTISAWKKRNSINYELLFAKCADIHKDWLLNGEGEMYVTKEGSVTDKTDKKQDVTLDKQPKNDRLNEVLRRVETLEAEAKKRDKGSDTIQIPLFMHAVAAGDPCSASSEIEKFIIVPKSITRHPESTWAVRASGDSMIGAGIETGDILIADHKAPVKDRCIVIASINGGQTVKRILLQSGAVVLAPENHHYQPMMLKETDDVKILGTILGIYRQLY